MNLKIVYTLFIVVGAALVLYEQAKETNQNIFLLATGFVLLMLGLYKVATQWVKDNREAPRGDDAVFFEDDEE